MSLPVSYTTASLMQMTLPEIGSISTMTQSLMLHHAGRAEAYINARLSKLYSMPLSSTSPILETLATDLAIYNVLTARISIEAEHPWFARYKGAIDMIEKIADGEIPMINSSGEIIGGRGDQSEFYSNNMNYIPTFYEGAEENQVRDKDKVDDETDRRSLTDYGDKVI